MLCIGCCSLLFVVNRHRCCCCCCCCCYCCCLLSIVIVISFIVPWASNNSADALVVCMRVCMYVCVCDADCDLYAEVSGSVLTNFMAFKDRKRTITVQIPQNSTMKIRRFQKKVAEFATRSLKLKPFDGGKERRYLELQPPQWEIDHILGAHSFAALMRLPWTLLYPLAHRLCVTLVFLFGPIGRRHTLKCVFVHCTLDWWYLLLYHVCFVFGLDCVLCIACCAVYSTAVQVAVCTPGRVTATLSSLLLCAVCCLPLYCTVQLAQQYSEQVGRLTATLSR